MLAESTKQDLQEMTDPVKGTGQHWYADYKIQCFGVTCQTGACRKQGKKAGWCWISRGTEGWHMKEEDGAWGNQKSPIYLQKLNLLKGMKKDSRLQ